MTYGHTLIVSQWSVSTCGGSSCFDRNNTQYECLLKFKITGENRNENETYANWMTSSKKIAKISYLMCVASHSESSSSRVNPTLAYIGYIIEIGQKLPICRAKMQ